MNGATSSTTAVIPNNRVNQLVGDSTFILAGPRIGSMVTLYRAATNTTANLVIISTSSSGQVSFNSLGGTQKLILCPTTAAAGEDISVTMLVRLLLSGASSARGRSFLQTPRLTGSRLRPKPLQGTGGFGSPSLLGKPYENTYRTNPTYLAQSRSTSTGASPEHRRV